MQLKINSRHNLKAKTIKFLEGIWKLYDLRKG